MKYSSSLVRASSFAGFGVIVIFAISVLLAHAFYPGEYSPFTNWISDLGNEVLNPAGALFMNAGFVLMGVAFFPFFIGLRRWHAHSMGGAATFSASAVAGFTTGTSLVMIGIFPENYAASHAFWAATFFGSMGFFLLLSSVHLFYCRGADAFAKRASYIGFLAFAADASFGLLFFDRIFEWAAAIGSLIYVVSLSYAMLRKS